MTGPEVLEICLCFVPMLFLGFVGRFYGKDERIGVVC